MWTATVNKTFEDSDGSEIMYSFSATASTEQEAIDLVMLYVSMVEYGTLANEWAPGDMAFSREQLLQFIQRSQLENIEAMYPNVVANSYMNALSYIQTYIGNMFDVEAMLSSDDTSSSSAITLRLSLCLCTAIYVLASSPQYSDTIECHQKRLETLLKGLQRGSRNMGRQGIVAEPNVRAIVVKRTNSVGVNP